MVILILSITVLVLIIILALALMFINAQLSSFDALWKTSEHIGSYCDKFVILYDKYRAAENDSDKAKIVKEMLDVAQDINNNHYRNIEENRKFRSKTINNK